MATYTVPSLDSYLTLLPVYTVLPTLLSYLYLPESATYLPFPSILPTLLDYLYLPEPATYLSFPSILPTLTWLPISSLDSYLPLLPVYTY